MTFLLVILALMLFGCASASWSYLYTQKPSSAQGAALVREVSARLTHDLGFVVVPSRKSGSEIYRRVVSSDCTIQVDLAVADYPLIYITAPKKVEQSKILQEVFRSIEDAYQVCGLAKPTGPARETWFPLQ